MNEALKFIILRFCLIAIEIALFTLPFFLTVKKKKYWLVKIVTVIVLTIGITIGTSYGLVELYILNHWDKTLISWMGGLFQLFILVMLGLGFKFCFNVSLYELGSIISLGYATRWVIFCLYSLILNFINPELILIRIGQQTPLNIAIYLIIYLVYYSFSIFGLFKGKKNLNYVFELPSFIICSLIIVTNTILLSFAEAVSEDHLIEYSFVLISNIITVSLIIVVNFYSQRKIKLSLENELMNSMLEKQAEQYKFNKANAEMMHVKAHDLKHQIDILRKGGPDAEKILDELDSVVSGYESIILTDNNVINVILSEKWQYCIKHKIKMTCNVDPKALSKIETIHLYTMLGNILDNAIEAVMKIKEKNKRIISINISYNHGISVIQCYNYFTGDITMHDNLPLTSKNDKGVHGFGMKSIQNIVKLYDGDMEIDIDDNIFNLLITIPE